MWMRSGVGCGEAENQFETRRTNISTHLTTRCHIALNNLVSLCQKIIYICNNQKEITLYIPYLHIIRHNRSSVNTFRKITCKTPSTKPQKSAGRKPPQFKRLQQVPRPYTMEIRRMIIEMNPNPPPQLGQIKMQRSPIPIPLPHLAMPLTLRFARVRSITLTITLTITIVLILATLVTETAYARHSPNRRDRRPDREVRVRYPNTQPQSSRGPVLHSAPATPEPSPPVSSDAERSATPGAD